MVDTLAGAAAAAAFTAVFGVVAVAFKHGSRFAVVEDRVQQLEGTSDRLTALETNEQAFKEWLSRVEKKIDRAIEHRG